jgi:hypothetical protein
MSCKSFHLYNVEFDLWIVESTGLPSIVETVGVRQVMWFVMLESAKDRVIGVDTPGQQVPPHVRYGMTCLLIRDVVRSVPCSDEGNLV